MVRLCSRPGCSEQGTVAYGMVPEDLLFWMSPPAEAPTADASVLCRHHADAMVVPRGWTLDDRRENVLRLFRPRPPQPPEPRPARASRRTRPAAGDERPEQLQIDGTGEIERPPEAVLETSATLETSAAGASSAASPTTGSVVVESPPVESPVATAVSLPWEPEFDHDDDLGGLLEVESPLLARAFRGTGRPR